MKYIGGKVVTNVCYMYMVHTYIHTYIHTWTKSTNWDNRQDGCVYYMYVWSNIIDTKCQKKNGYNLNCSISLVCIQFTV